MPANRPKPTLRSCIRSEVSPLECAVPRFRLLTPLECAVTKTRSPKSFRMRSSEKKWGGGALSSLFSCHLPLTTRHYFFTVPRGAWEAGLPTCSWTEMPSASSRHRAGGLADVDSGGRRSFGGRRARQPTGETPKAAAVRPDGPQGEFDRASAPHTCS